MKEINKLRPFTRFCCTIGNIPTSYMESLTYEEQLLWLCDYLENTVIPTVNNNAEAVEELQNLYIILKNYVDNYFNNLDVQEEINNKLDNMVVTGAFNVIVKNYLDPYINEQNNRISSFEQTIETQITDIQHQVESSVSGSPAGVYATLQDLQSSSADHNKIYVVNADGKWYYYNTSTNQWTAGGVYQSSVNFDQVEANKLSIDAITDKGINLLFGKVNVPYKYTNQQSGNTLVISTYNLDPTNGKFDMKLNKYYLTISKFIVNKKDGMYGSAEASMFISDTATTYYGYNIERNKISLSQIEIGKEVTLYNIATPDQNKNGMRSSIVINGVGTAQRDVDIDFIQWLAIEFDSEEEARRFLNYIKYSTQYGIVVVNDVKIQDKISELESEIEDLEPIVYDTDIIFWGDSLTAGAGGGNVTYPNVVRDILNKTIINNGIGGETSNTISARQGGNQIIIPAGNVNGTYTSNDLKDIFGGTIAPLIQGGGSTAGKIIINGQECTLACTNVTDKIYQISGYSGVTTMPYLGTLIGSKQQGRVTVLFVGTNGTNVDGSHTVDDAIAVINSMIKHLHNDKYVVMYYTQGTTKDADETKLLKEYGNKYMPYRPSLIKYGLNMSGITPTTQDNIDIQNGNIPISLRSDGVHLNANGYTVIGKLLADRIKSLGYFD